VYLANGSLESEVVLHKIYPTFYSVDLIDHSPCNLSACSSAST